MPRHVLGALLTLLLLLGCAVAAVAQEEVLTFDPFGEVRCFVPPKAPRQVVVLLSGVDGLGPMDEAIAQELNAANVLVIGVDIARWSKAVAASDEDCPNSSLELENLSKFVQKRLELPRLITPVLVGRDAGATLVYANLVQAPETTFLGGVSLGFAPELPMPKELCLGKALHQELKNGILSFAPVTTFPLRWQVISPAGQRHLTPREVRLFQRGMDGAGQTIIPGGSLSSFARFWAQPLRRAVLRMAKLGAVKGPGGELAGLPLVEVDSDVDTDYVALFYSGDGGWAPLDADLSDHLSDHGVSVVGVNSLRYFWIRKTPEVLAEDAARILTHYMKEWDRSKVVLIGYSLGAEALPFIANRLPPELRGKLVLVAMLSPGTATDLEFDVSDWVSEDQNTPLHIELKPEVDKVGPGTVVCLYGVEDDEALCPLLNKQEAKVIGLPGSHHFNGDHARLAKEILSALGIKADDL